MLLTHAISYESHNLQVKVTYSAEEKLTTQRSQGARLSLHNVKGRAAFERGPRCLPDLGLLPSSQLLNCLTLRVLRRDLGETEGPRLQYS